MALDMGTINIYNKEVANFIENRTIDELKSLFINFLTKEVEVRLNHKIDNIIVKKREPNLLKGKIVYFEDFNSSDEEIANLFNGEF
jgi:hypothetical protein